MVRRGVPPIEGMSVCAGLFAVTIYPAHSPWRHHRRARTGGGSARIHCLPRGCASGVLPVQPPDARAESPCRRAAEALEEAIMSEEGYSRDSGVRLEDGGDSVMH